MLHSLSRYLRFSFGTASKIINPYTHEPLALRPYLTQPQIYQRVTECNRDYHKWRNVSISDRKSLVSKFASSVIKDKQLLKPMVADFTGKSYKNIDQQFTRIQKVIDKLIDDSQIALKQQTITRSFGGKSVQVKISHDPVGLAIIFPYFSQPIFDSLIHLVPCLISGNGALLKASDFNHFLGQYMNKKCHQVLGYKNLINDAFIHPSSLPTLRQFRPIKKINFSGSRNSARRVFQVMVENRFIDCNLFYGAQQAAYVDQTADLQLASQQICKYSFYNNGQSYDCIRRLYVHEAIQQALIQKIILRIQKLKLGNPKDPQTDLGPISIQQSVIRFQQLINDAINMDAKCLIGGMTTTDGKTKGLFCEPTLLTNCDPSMQVIQQQINAPLLCLSTVQGFQNFVTQVQDNAYGTGIRIFTENPLKYKSLVKQLDVGIISFNSGSITNSDLPIQGWKGSGKGKILSQLSYQQFVIPKTTIISDL